ncbi:hypothetical protein DPMN_029975 [Dreissena polymorpha]|uniref:Uncharacterized protein n=1 Tax=Dreissena polymorpha TaxID=45954 RepID=A0A9D4RHM0_DREPO|nr:hypothetical protein DPMN_029975 [Dreissena polymorpha]
MRREFKPCFRKHVSVVDGYHTGNVGFPPDIPVPLIPQQKTTSSWKITAILRNSSDRGDAGIQTRVSF